MKTATQSPPDLMRRAEVLDLLAKEGIRITGKTLTNWCSSGIFPKPLRITFKTILWPRSKVLAAIKKLTKVGGPDYAA